MNAAQFTALPAWADQLPASMLDELHHLHKASRPTDARLLPRDQGASMDEQHEKGHRRFLSCPEPFCLVRIGDCEIGLLGAGYVPSGRQGLLAWNFKRAGFCREALGMRSAFIEAIRHAEFLGLQEGWPVVREDTAALLAMLGMELPRPNGIEVHLIYRLLVDGTLFSRLEGRNILLVGALAPKLAAAWKNPAFLKAYERFGVGKVKSVRALGTRPREEGGSWADYERILVDAKRDGFDTALLSCGVTAKPLAWEIRKTGRTALDVGFVFDALLAENVAERSQRPVLGAASWPKKQW